jgi:hypothetical protein
MYAQAGNIQLNISTCDSFTLTGTAGNQTLNCVISNAPTGCQIQGPTTGTNGNTITLTGVCATGSPTTWAWSGGNCQGNTTQSCQATGSNATVNYSVVISNAIGAGIPNPATKQVLWSNALPVPPSNCTITPSPASLPVGGGSVNLTAQCAGGDAVNTWNWSNATYTTTSGNTASATIGASTTFKVTPTNAGGSSNGSVLVSVAGGGGGPIACAGYLNTNVFTATWPLTQNATLSMGTLDAGVVKFTTGSGTGNGQISLSTSGNNAGTHHNYTLSTQSCDFTSGLKQFLDSGAPMFRFTVSSTPGAYPNLLPNTTYYINVNNASVNAQTGAATGCVSTASTCDLFPINLSGPK